MLVADDVNVRLMLGCMLFTYVRVHATYIC